MSLYSSSEEQGLRRFDFEGELDPFPDAVLDLNCIGRVAAHTDG